MRLSSRLLGAPLAAAALLVLGVALAIAQDSGVVKPSGSKITKPSQGVAVPGPRSGTKTKPGTGPGAVHASIELDCGDKKYEVATGSDKGVCVKDSGTDVDSHDDVVYCKDSGGGKNNQAVASCSRGCVETDGAGSCHSIGN